MTYGQDPQMLAKKGNSWNPSRHERPAQEPNPSPELIKAIAAILGGAMGNQPQFENSLMEQDMMRRSPQPNALTGGVTHAGPQKPFTASDGNVYGQWHPDDFPGGRESAYGQANPDGAWANYGPEPSRPQILDGDLFATDTGARPPGGGPSRGRTANISPYEDGAINWSLTGRLQNGEPNALSGGIDGGYEDVVAEGDPNKPAYKLMIGEGNNADGSPLPKPKKKGEYSDFFKLLKAAKSGDKTTKKSLKDLAKQLEASGGEVPVS